MRFGMRSKEKARCPKYNMICIWLYHDGCRNPTGKCIYGDAMTSEDFYRLRKEMEGEILG